MLLVVSVKASFVVALVRSSLLRRSPVVLLLATAVCGVGCGGTGARGVVGGGGWSAAGCAGGIYTGVIAAAVCVGVDGRTGAVKRRRGGHRAHVTLLHIGTMCSGEIGR